MQFRDENFIQWNEFAKRYTDIYINLQNVCSLNSRILLDSNSGEFLSTRRANTSRYPEIERNGPHLPDLKQTDCTKPIETSSSSS